MNKRVITVIIIVILVAFLAVAGYYGYQLYLVKPSPDAGLNLTNGAQTFIANNNSNSNINKEPEVPVTQDNKIAIQFLAKVFGQNFGTYSNQTNLTNFDEIYGFMGAAMKNWVQNTHKAEIMSQHPRDVYYALETKVLFSKVTEIDEAKGTASAMLNTQRQEFKENPDNVNVFSQDLLLNLVKVDDQWLVDSAYWQ